MTEAPSSPFKGLSAFDDSEVDALFFFGREREREIVVANLIASRLTVLYGPSGVGKSSLLRAAVARSLRSLPEQPLVVVFSRWSEDPAAALAEAVAATNGTPAGAPALETLEHAQSERDLYLVLDQAEEYFLYHAEDAGPGSFAELLPAVLATPWRVNVLFSLREDSLAKLDRFAGRIPGVFANTLRLDRLDRESARAAIVRPVERFGELTGEAVAVEPELVERVLDEVGTGRIEPALGGLGAVEGDEPGGRIEAPYLQLVMQRLWDEERAAGSDALRAATLAGLGGARHVVEEHLEGALAELTPEEKDVASRLFNHLVTPSGTKIAHDASDLADFGQVPEHVLAPVLAVLADRRILRSLDEGGAVRYEIFHDVLAQPMLAWRARHRTERAIEQQLADSHRRRRRLQLLVAVALVVIGLLAATTTFALAQRGEAREQAREAKALELEAVARGQLDSDPELGLLLAREGALLARTPSSEQTLGDALRTSRLRGVVQLGAPALGATAKGPEVVAATVGGSLVTANASTGEVLRRTERIQGVDTVSFADDGTALLADSDGSLSLVRPVGVVRRVSGGEGVLGSALSVGGDVAVIVQDGGDATRLIETASGRVLQAYDRPGTVSAAISRRGRYVATGYVGRTVRVWEAPSAVRLLKLFGHVGKVVAVTFGPREGLVASASVDGTARIWRVSTGESVAVLTGHGNALTDIEFSPDGKRVVTASADRTARLWRADTGALLAVLRGHEDVVTSAVFTDAGTSVVTASADGTARIWDAEVLPQLDVLARLAAPISDVRFETDGLRVVAGDGRMHVLDPAGKERRAEPAARRSARVTGPGGRTARIEGDTVVVRTPSGSVTLEGHEDRVSSAAFSPDGMRLVTASRDHEARIWNLETGDPLVLVGHLGPVQDARFSADGRWVVTAGTGRAGLWDASTGRLVVFLRGHKGALTSAGFDASGHKIVTGGVDGTVRTYRCEICGGAEGLIELARRRLEATGRELTAEERERYLG